MFCPVLQRHARQGNAHGEDRQAVEHVVQPLELEAAQKVRHQREPRLAHVGPDIVDPADEIDRRKAPPQGLEIGGLGLAHDLQPDAFPGQHRRGVGEKGFHRGPLGRPIEAADQDGPARHVVVDRAGLEPCAGISGRQEDDGTSLGTRGEPTAIVGRVRRHQVGRGDQPALQAPHLEIVDRLRHTAQAAGGLDDAARRP